jgi:hypothetical protein
LGTGVASAACSEHRGKFTRNLHSKSELPPRRCQFRRTATRWPRCTRRAHVVLKCPADARGRLRGEQDSGMRAALPMSSLQNRNIEGRCRRNQRRTDVYLGERPPSARAESKAGPAAPLHLGHRSPAAAALQCTTTGNRKKRNSGSMETKETNSSSSRRASL